MEPFERAHRDMLEIACAPAELAALRESMTPEHVLHQSVIEGLPPGLAATAGLFRLYRDALSELTVSIEDHLAEGDRAVTRFRARGRHTGPLGAIAPTGLPVELTGMLASRFDPDGRAVESWLEVSALGLLRDLGVIEMVNPVRVVEC